MGGGCTQPTLGGPGPICLPWLPTSSHRGQSGGEGAGPHMQQDHAECPRMADHVLGLGPSGPVEPNPIMPAESPQSVDSPVRL